MTKAAEKRLKDLRSALTRQLNGKLILFKNHYLMDQVRWNELKINKRIQEIKDIIGNPDKLHRINLEEEGEARCKGKRYWHKTTKLGLEAELKRLEAKIQRAGINHLEWLTQANLSYQNKLEKLIEKLIKYGIDQNEFTVERIVTNGMEFEFLIKDPSKEIHARVIYAQGLINAPHYRFIVTKRDL